MENEGIWLDYQNGQWIFCIQDVTWNKEQLKLLKRKGAINLFVKGIVSGFTVEIDEGLETSDIPLCIKDADETVLSSLKESFPYTYRIVFYDASMKIMYERSGQFTADNSRKIREALNNIYKDYKEEEFESALAKLYFQYEPFELEPFYVMTQAI